LWYTEVTIGNVQEDMAMADSFLQRVSGQLGALPNFFRSGQAAPGVVEELWGFAKSAYLGVTGERADLAEPILDTTDADKVHAGQDLRLALEELRQTEMNLRRSEEHLRLAFLVAHGVGTWDWNVFEDRVVADAGFSKVYGVDPARGGEGFPIENFTRNLHPDDKRRVEREIATAIESGEDYRSEYRVLQADGSFRWVMAIGRCTYATDGSPLRFPGISVDITEQKRLAASVAETEKQLQIAVEGAGLASWFYDPLRNIVGGDAKMRALFDLEVAEGPAEVWLAAIHPHDRDRVAREFAAGAESEPFDTEYRICQRDGTLRWVRAKGQLVVTAGEKRMVGICEDFTRRRLTEESLRSTATRLSLAQQTGKMASWQWDLATGNFVWDEASGWTYGRPPSEMCHVDMIFPYLVEEDREKVRRDLRPAVEGWGEYRSEFRVIWPDSSVHWIQAFGKSILSSEGKPVAVVGINMDVTERKTAKLALMQTEKLAAVGRLASSIAHEINNPLESVTNLLYLARKNPDSPALDAYLDMAERELQRVSGIALQTLRFYRQTTNASPLRCSDLLEETLWLYHGRLVNSKIRVEARERLTRPAVCLVGEIRQILSNLIGNAIDAMPNGGRLLLRCREATHWKTQARGIAITVADTGSGMPQQVRNRVFEAFFSTKGHNGTGLGLWVSKELIGKNRGALTLRTSTRAASHGTVFVIFVPYAIVPA
jgi:PAS domain S-box-containing protein